MAKKKAAAKKTASNIGFNKNPNNPAYKPGGSRVGNYFRGLKAEKQGKPRTGAGKFFLGDQPVGEGGLTNPELVQKTPLHTPEAQALINANIAAAMKQLENAQVPVTRSTLPQPPPLQPLTNTDFSPIENQYRSSFAQQTVPSIAERFSNLGAQRSSAFGQQLGAAGANLNTDLAALKAQHGFAQNQQALQQNQQIQNQFVQQQQLEQALRALDNSEQQQLRNYLSQLTSVGLIPQYDINVKEGAKGALGSLSTGLMNALQNAPGLLAAYFSGGKNLGAGAGNNAETSSGASGLQKVADVLSGLNPVQQEINPAARNIQNVNRSIPVQNTGLNQQALPQQQSYNPAAETINTILSTPYAQSLGLSKKITPSFSDFGTQASRGMTNPQFGENDYGPSSNVTNSPLDVLKALSNTGSFNPQLRAILAGQGAQFGQ